MAKYWFLSLIFLIGCFLLSCEYQDIDRNYISDTRMVVGLDNVFKRVSKVELEREVLNAEANGLSSMYFGDTVIFHKNEDLLRLERKYHLIPTTTNETSIGNKTEPQFAIVGAKAFVKYSLTDSNGLLYGPYSLNVNDSDTKTFTGKWIYSLYFKHKSDSNASKFHVEIKKYPDLVSRYWLEPGEERNMTSQIITKIHWEFIRN